MALAPLGLVPLEKATDLGGALGERADIGGELLDLTIRVEGVPARGQRGPELRVAGDRGVPDPVDRLNRIAERDGVQPAPFPGGEDTGVDLQMQMPVRIPARDV